MSETTCPIFYPDEQQFHDFRAFVQGIEETHPDIAICKVVPPKSWFVTNYDMEHLEETLIVKHPIKQVATGRAGIYQLDLYELSDMSLKQFKRTCDQYQPESQNYMDRERRFWSSLGFSSGVGYDPIYGADILGTLFTGEESHSEWNLNYLENLLRLLEIEESDDEEDGDNMIGDGKQGKRQKKGNHHNKRNTTTTTKVLEGITKPMLYIGSWRAMFAFHVEDVDLYSINYLHLGAEKSWYAIPPTSRKKFENFAASEFEGDRRLCPEFLRHKTKIFSPTQLKNHAIPFTTAVQQPGEFIITFPGAYHAGFNHGFNIAEAVNFAFRRWINIGRKAQHCRCQPDTVHIDVNYLETLFLRKRCQFKRYQSYCRKGIWDKNNKVRCFRDIFRSKCRSVERSNLYFMTEILDDSLEYFDEFDGCVRCLCPMKHLYEQYLVSDTLHDDVADNVDRNVAGTSSSSSTVTRQCVQCQGCSLWFHPDCIRAAYTTVYDLSFLEVPLCHYCERIDHVEKQVATEVQCLSSSSSSSSNKRRDLGSSRENVDSKGKRQKSQIESSAVIKEQSSSRKSYSSSNESIYSRPYVSRDRSRTQRRPKIEVINVIA
jgi:jumonji domain-containing protein 2